MRSLAAAVTAALAQRALVARTFFWITAKDSGSPVSVGFWNDLDTATFSVIDGLTGSTVSRQFYASGSLIAVDDVPLTSDLGVRELSATLSQINADVIATVRGYDIRRAPVQIHRGLFSLTSRSLVAPAVCRFVGFVDSCRITTPKEGGFGSIELRLASFARELTRANTETRSDESQKARSTGDRFYRYTGIMGGVSIFWGVKRSVASQRQLARQKRRNG